MDKDSPNAFQNVNNPLVILIENKRRSSYTGGFLFFKNINRTPDKITQTGRKILNFMSLFGVLECWVIDCERARTMVRQTNFER